MLFCIPHQSLMMRQSPEWVTVRRHTRLKSAVSSSPHDSQETGRHVIIKGIMCKVSRCNLTKLEAIQARHHMQHATTFDSAKLKQAPGMVVCGN